MGEQTLNLLTFIVPEFSTFIRTDGQVQIGSDIDHDQDYKSEVIWSATTRARTKFDISSARHV